MNYDDLMQEGRIALLRAIDRFDSNRKVKFITYASFCIKMALKMYYREKYDLIKIPHNAYELINKKNLNKYEEKLKNFALIKRISMEGVDKSDEEIIDYAINFDYLDTREKYIIINRFWNNKSLEKIGINIGISREWVRKIQNEALRKLKIHNENPFI
jgi:RNA polymerase sigma factor (sigma-70 family)